MHIYLVRHTKYHNPENIFPFHLPVYLSAEGRAHAQRIASWFKAKNLTNLPIFTSPIVRCVQTSEIIAPATHSFVACDDRLIETHSPGVQGTVQPKEDAWKVEEEDPHRESRDSVRERARSIFDEKVQQGLECILVTHGDPITILYYDLLGKKLPKNLWSPENAAKVIDRGEIVDVEVHTDGSMTLTKHTV